MNHHDDAVDWSHKGFWRPGIAQSNEEFLASAPTLFDGAFTWPVMVLRQRAIDHNLTVLANFCREHDLEFAPHGKTTMAPALYARQIDAGAWGITLATPSQVAVGRQFGIRRILLANEVVDTTAIEWIATDLHGHPDHEFYCFVDSVAGVHQIAEGLRSAAAAAGMPVDDYVPGGFTVLLDIGYPGGRTGCRDAEVARAVATAVRDQPGLRLAGLSAYEGGLATAAEAEAYLQDVSASAVDLWRRGLLAADAIITAGGSAYFDVVADVYGREWPSGFTPVIILRSGAYVTHDDGVYTTKTPFNRIAGHLDAAIEVWAQVISPGDPGRVIVNMGKRDAPYDDGLPVPLHVRRRGSTDIAEFGSGEVERMDDQHCYLRTDAELVPGDLVGFGISHPCTAFDKWRMLPMVDDDHRVVDLVRTYF